MTKFKTYFTLFLTFVIVQFSIAQEWQAINSVPDDFRTDHTFGFGIDGTGYIVTGARFDGVFTKSFYSYDPTTDTWTKKEDFPGPARSFAIGDVYEGKAYLGFGADSNFNILDDLWVYDPATDEWTELASCECLARTHPAMNIVDGKIYVGMGGSNQGNRNDWWEYDIATNIWTRRADFPAAPRHHPFQFVADGQIFAGFGHGDGFISNEWYKYDHTSDEWIQVLTLPGEGRVAGTQFSHGAMGYVLSGDGSDHQSMEEGEFWQYDPSNNQWTEMPSHPGLSRWAPASFVVDDEVYLIGGYSTGIGYPSTSYKFPLTSVMVNTDEAELPNIALYPNPAKDILHLKTSARLSADTPIKIYTANGQLAQTAVAVGGTIDITSLATGLYFAAITTEENTTVKTAFTKQ